MCDEIEQMKKAERIKIAQRMLSSEKFTYDKIAYFTNLTLEEIKVLIGNMHNIEYAKKQKKPIFCPSIEIVVDKIQTGTKKLIDEGTASVIQQGRDIIGVLSALNSSITKPRLNNIEIKLNYLHTLLSILNAPIVLESTLKTLNINIPTNQDVYSTLVYMIKNNLINIDQLLNLLVENNISSINNTLIFNDSY